MNEIKYIVDHPPSLSQLTKLYTTVGWNESGKKSEKKNEIMLKRALHFVCAFHNTELIGFGKLIGDPYVAAIFDLITKPNYRNQGIASKVVSILVELARNNGNEAVLLIHGAGDSNLYDRLGFREVNPGGERIMYYNF